MARYTSHSFLFPAGNTIGTLADDDLLLVADADDSNAALDVALSTVSTKIRADAISNDDLSTIVNASDLTYTPATLIGGTGATSVLATWQAVADGTFTITTEATAHDVTGCDFSGASDMDGVAAIIQTELRAVSTGTETVVWDTDHFIITSGDTTIGSHVSKATAEGTGTDISGVGATAFMDCDAGAADEVQTLPRYTVLSTDKAKILVLDEGVTINAAGIDVELPAAVANFRIQVINIHSGPKDLNLYCQTGDLINIGAVISDTDLFITGGTQYDSADLVAVDGTLYFAVSSQGTWVQG